MVDFDIFIEQFGIVNIIVYYFDSVVSSDEWKVVIEVIIFKIMQFYIEFSLYLGLWGVFKVFGEMDIVKGFDLVCVWYFKLIIDEFCWGGVDLFDDQKVWLLEVNIKFVQMINQFVKNVLDVIVVYELYVFMECLGGVLQCVQDVICQDVQSKGQEDYCLMLYVFML